MGKGKPGTFGNLIVRAEAVKSSNMVCHFRIQGMSLPNINRSCMGMCSSVMPVRYEWHKARPGDLNNFTKVYSSTSIGSTHDPHWPAEKYNIATICGTDLDSFIRIVLFSGHKTLGYAQGTLNELKKNPTMKLMCVPGRSGGQITFSKFELKERPSFVEYLRSGW